MPCQDSEILEQMLDYIQQTIEVPHPTFGNMPICPFARQARLADKFLYKICAFSNSDLHSNSELVTFIQNFGQQAQYELLLVIHPEPEALDLGVMHRFTENLNRQIAAFDLIAFDGHPQDDFNVQGVYTRQAPYIHFTVQPQHRVKQASDRLRHTSYYQNWTHQHFKYVGLLGR